MSLPSLEEELLQEYRAIRERLEARGVELPERPRRRAPNRPRQVPYIVRETLRSVPAGAGAQLGLHAAYPTAERTLCGLVVTVSGRAAAGEGPPTCSLCLATAKAYLGIDRSAPAEWFRLAPAGGFCQATTGRGKRCRRAAVRDGRCPSHPLS